MKAGSAAQVLTAGTESEEQREALDKAAFSATDLIQVRKRGWAASVAQREPGVASLSAPVRDATGTVIAAISISGPVDPLAKATKAQINALLAAANQLEAAIAN
jgi:DNA-binding IclR family transcriptional regulator